MEGTVGCRVGRCRAAGREHPGGGGLAAPQVEQRRQPGESGEGEGDGCLAAGTVLASAGNGACNNPKVVTVAAPGIFVIQTGTGQTNGNNANLDSCVGGTSARDVIFQVNLPTGVASVHATVDAAGHTPVVKIHSGAGCGNTASQCAAAAGACASATAVAGTDFNGTSIFISVSELTATATDYALRLDVQ